MNMFSLVQLFILKGSKVRLALAVQLDFVVHLHTDCELGKKC